MPLKCKKIGLKYVMLINFINLLINALNIEFISPLPKTKKNPTMIKNLIFVCCFAAGLLFATAQERKDLPNGACGTDDLHLKLLKENSDYREKFDKNNAIWQDWAPKHSKTSTKPQKSNANREIQTWSPVVLQVVFHNMHCLANNPEIPNTYPDYSSIVDKLNAIYAGSALAPYIPSTINDAGIQFCLAKQDVLGNAYTSTQTQHLTTLSTIDRRDIDQIIQTANDSGSLLTFPRTRYINIYIVDDILSGSGFAFLPSAHGLNVEGIYLERQLFNGSDEAELNAKITTLAHEMGHYLGLFHTFGICEPDALTAGTPTSYACSCANINPFADGDKVDDTQPMELHDQSCNLPVSSCGNSTPDFKHNYMDYVSYECRYYFSPGQILRMQFMLDSDYGARKSLLRGASACTNCIAMTGYQPVITPITNTVFQLNQLAGTNFSANFQNGNTAFTPTPFYTWSLQFLDSGTALTNLINSAFTLNTALAVGNYSLTLKADIGNGCFKTTTFLFTVVPNASSDACVTLPDPTSAAGWGAWNRVYYEGGWSRATEAANSGWSYPTTTVRTPIASTTPDVGFQILDLAELAQNDTNFSNITSPPLSANTKIMRVGRKIDGFSTLKDGAAYYVNYTFTPTPANCKYRIWYIGMSNIIPILNGQNNTIAYQSFNTNQSGLTSFGVLSRYKFNSPVISGAVTDLGMNENGYLVDNPVGGGFVTNRKAKLFGLNDMVFNRIHSPVAATDYNNVTLGSIVYARTTVWKYYDLDFSEFVDKPGENLMNTQVTLTFFARTNDSVEGKSHSYAYYGIECKGGGMPANITMDLPNIQLPCQAPATSNCAYTINLPRPKFALERKLDNGNSYFSWLNPNLTDINTFPNLASLTVATAPALPLTGAPGVFSPITADFNTYVNTIQTDNSLINYQLKLCNNEAPNASIYYKVTLKTLHKTLESVFKVTNGYKTNSPPCAQRLGTIVGPAIRYVCADQAAFDLQYNDSAIQPCSDELIIPGPPKYKWKMKTCTDATCTTFTEDIEIPNQVGATLSVIPANLVGCVTLYTRYTEYNDLFCGKSYFPEQTFTVYNTTSFNAGSFTPNTQDICINGQVKVDVKGFKLSLPSCIFPTPINPNGSAVKFELVKNNNDTAQEYLTAANTINYNTLTTDAQPDFTLSFNNFNGISYVFPSNGRKTIYIKITYTILGCTKIVYTAVIFHIVNSSAPGAIKVSGVTCSTFSILNADIPDAPSVTYPAGTYGWQYATAATGPFSQLPAIPGNSAPPDGITLTNYPFNLLTCSQPLTCSPPFYIRRVAYGLDSCSFPNSFTVPVKVTNIPDFPATLSYCSSSQNTALSIVAPNGVKGSWSPTFVGQIPSSNTTATQLTTNYTFTVEGNCGIQQVVSVQIVRPTRPTATSPQIKCAGARISDLEAQTTLTGATIRWTLTGGGGQSFINPNTLLTSSTYFVGQSLPVNEASCIGLKQAVVVTITTPVPPTAAAQTYCAGATVANLVAIGTGIKWYSALTGGMDLANNTTLTSGNYFASQTINGCESTRTQVTVTVNAITPAPTALEQTYCAGATVANLVATGTGIIKWYNALTGGTALANNTTLTSSNYFASQTINGCESTRTQVTVTINPNTLIAVNDSFTLLSGTTTSVLANDTVNAVSVIIVPVGAVPTFTSGGITLNADGTLTVLPSTTMGTYTFQYKLQGSCGASNTATITIVVAPPSITCPSKCSFRICYQNGPQTTPYSENFFDAPYWDGVGGILVDGIPGTEATVSIELAPGSSLPTGMTLNQNGTFAFEAGFGASISAYDFFVIFCKKTAPFSCTPPVRISITVNTLQPNNDSYHLNTSGEPTFTSENPANVYANDNGCDSVENLSTVTVNQLPPLNDFLSIDDEGILNPGETIPAGIHTLNYQICRISDPTICQNAVVTVYVSNVGGRYIKNESQKGNDFNNELKIKIYPNPTKQLVNLEFDNFLNEKIEIELFNLLGQKILTKTTSLNAEVLDLSPYPLGTYLVKFTSKDFNTTKKLTKN